MYCNKLTNQLLYGLRNQEGTLRTFLNPSLTHGVGDEHWYKINAGNSRREKGEEKEKGILTCFPLLDRSPPKPDVLRVLGRTTNLEKDWKPIEQWLGALPSIEARKSTIGCGRGGANSVLGANEMTCDYL
jgi:hypothetical protein